MGLAIVAELFYSDVSEIISTIRTWVRYCNVNFNPFVLMKTNRAEPKFKMPDENVTVVNSTYANETAENNFVFDLMPEETDDVTADHVESVYTLFYSAKMAVLVTVASVLSVLIAYGLFSRFRRKHRFHRQRQQQHHHHQDSKKEEEHLPETSTSNAADAKKQNAMQGMMEELFVKLDRMERKTESLVEFATSSLKLTGEDVLKEMTEIGDEFLVSLASIASVEAGRISELFENSVLVGTTQLCALRYRLEWIERKVDMMQDVIIDAIGDKSRQVPEQSQNKGGDEGLETCPNNEVDHGEGNPVSVSSTVSCSEEEETDPSPTAANSEPAGDHCDGKGDEEQEVLSPDAPSEANENTVANSEEPQINGRAKKNTLTIQLNFSKV